MERTRRRSPSDGVSLDDEFRPISCPNCGTSREGPYCHQCGQRYLKDRLTAEELWWIFADRFLDWEEGVWRTFLKMARSPGTVIRHYLGGKRKTYLNPFSYLLFCVGFYFIGQFLLRRLAGLSGIPGFEEVQEWGVAATNVEDQFTFMAYGAVVIVGLVALATKIMFESRLLNSMESIVTSLYASGNVFILALTVSAAEFLLTGDPLTFAGLMWTLAVLFPVCMGHAGYDLFENFGMACYTGMAPLVAGLLGAVCFFAVAGLLGLIFEMGPVVFTSASGAAGLLVFLFGPALILALYLLDFLS